MDSLKGKTAVITGATSGIGFRLGVAYDTINIPLMCVALMLLGLLGLASDRFLIAIARSFAPWLVFERQNPQFRQ